MLPKTGRSLFFRQFEAAKTLNAKSHVQTQAFAESPLSSQVHNSKNRDKAPRVAVGLLGLEKTYYALGWPLKPFENINI